MVYTFKVTETYTALPIRYSVEEGEWLMDIQTMEYKNFLRCDCHDAFWHWGEVHYIHTDDGGELIVCNLPFTEWPDHS